MATGHNLAVEASADASATLIAFSVNGRRVEVQASPGTRLSRILRDDLGLTGTKVGCDAGDCGACTVLLNGEPVCSCLVAAGQVAGCEVTTVEGLAQRPPLYDRLQKSFLHTEPRSAARARRECWLRRRLCWTRIHAPNEAEVMDAIGGVLCRCTGYRKIIACDSRSGAVDGHVR